MNDLIRRKDAIDSPVKMVSEGLEWIPVYYIKELPSAEPERKKGKWIDENEKPVGWHKVDKSCPAGWCKCSECGEWLVASDEYLVKGNFCPNCGADMRGERDEVD